MAEKKLTEEQQAFVVQSLACFDSPKTVADTLRKELGVDITPQTAEAYDPNKRAGAKLAAKWRALFDETRKAFLEDTSQIAISHRSVRLRSLQRMAEKAEGQGNMVLAASLMEQAAKEVGNSYTNKRELTGKNEAPLEAVTTIKLDAESVQVIRDLVK